MSEPTTRPRFRKRQVVLWLFLSMALVCAALLIPDAWLGKVQDVYDARPAPDAFSDGVEKFDVSLREGEANLSGERWSKLWPDVVVRRILQTGPMTSEDVDRARSMVVRHGGLARGDDAAAGELAAELAHAFPRLDDDALRDELKRFARQVRSARADEADAAPGGRPGSGALRCTSCHMRTLALPDGRSFDAVGIYPLIGADAFDGGRRLPVLTETTEVAAWKRRLPDNHELSDATCLDCHGAHGGTPGRISLERRRENLGLWVNASWYAGLVYVEVKLENRAAAHRIPGGYPGRAYAVVVHVTTASGRRALWWGPALPESLRSRRGEAGRLLRREMVDAAGEPTSDHLRAVDLIADSRLASDRWMLLRFLFEGGERPLVEATVYYLPDSMRWNGAVKVESVTERLR